MRFGTAIERLVDNYQYAKSKIWIRDKVAWALYHTWKEADDRKTEPIPHDDYIETENDHLEARCLNCNNAKACKEKHWEGCVYEPKDEKTCETCKYWKYIAHEWQCETTKCQGYTPNTKPQTDEHLQRLQMCVDCEHTDMCEWCSRWSKDEPQTERSE